MADEEKPIISAVRVLEYRGTKEWLDKVFNSSRLPLTGVFNGTPDAPLPKGFEIRSGMVIWDPLMTAQADEKDAGKVIPVPPPTGRVQ